MPTINDLDLTEAVLAAKAALHEADMAIRHGEEHRAFLELMQVETAARTAQYRLNQLRFDKGKP